MLPFASVRSRQLLLSSRVVHVPRARSPSRAPLGCCRVRRRRVHPRLLALRARGACAPRGVRGLAAGRLPPRPRGAAPTLHPDPAGRGSGARRLGARRRGGALRLVRVVELVRAARRGLRRVPAGPRARSRGPRSGGSARLLSRRAHPHFVRRDSDGRWTPALPSEGGARFGSERHGRSGRDGHRRRLRRARPRSLPSWPAQARPQDAAGPRRRGVGRAHDDVAVVVGRPHDGGGHRRCALGCRPGDPRCSLGGLDGAVRGDAHVHSEPGPPHGGRAARDARDARVAVPHVGRVRALRGHPVPRELLHHAAHPEARRPRATGDADHLPGPRWSPRGSHRPRHG